MAPTYKPDEAENESYLNRTQILDFSASAMSNMFLSFKPSKQYFIMAALADYYLLIFWFFALLITQGYTVKNKCILLKEELF